MKYLVQAILHDGDIETVVDSFKTDSYEDTVKFLMRKHHNCTKYQYAAMCIETGELVVNTTKNDFAW